MKTPETAPVVVLGATPNPARYAYLATEMLVQHGYQPLPVGPREGAIAGRSILPDLAAAETAAGAGGVDTLTLYLGPDRQADVAEAIVALRPRRVIFNPGTENAELEQRLEAAGIATLEACTLVLLRSGQF